jgi:hypothetical protein
VRYDIWSKLLVPSDLDRNNTLMIVHFVDIGGIVDHQEKGHGQNYTIVKHMPKLVLLFLISIHHITI